MACSGAWKQLSGSPCPLLQSTLFIAETHWGHARVLAEKSWKQRTAEAMDMEVSLDDEDEDAPAAKKPRLPQHANDGSSSAHMQRVSRQL